MRLRYRHKEISMRSVVRSFRVWLKLLLLSICTLLLVTLRYILKTPQPLESVLPGEARVYKWVYGHIFYKSIGASDAPPLVLIHAPGIGASSYEMCSLMERLAQHYHVYALDLLGFGLSDHPKGEYSAQTYVRLCHDFLTEVVGRPATLLASGLSYQYCCAVATEYPALCERCIFLIPAVVFEERSVPSWLARSLSEPALCTALYALVTRRPILRSLLAWQSGRDYSSISDAMLDSYYASARQPGAQYAAIAFLAGNLATRAYALQTVSLAQPTLLMASERVLDRLLPALEELRTRWPQVQIVQLQNLTEQEELAVKHVMVWRNTAETKVPVAVVVQESIEHEVMQAPVQAHQPLIAQDIANDSTTEEAEQLRAGGDEPVASQPAADEQAVTNHVVEAVKEMPGTMRTVEAYCVKCRKKRKMQQPKKIVTKKGRSAIEGLCPICGTKLFRFVAGQA